MLARWIAVDFDGTLATRPRPLDGPQDEGKIDRTLGEPIPLMVNRVKRWLAEGKDVRIFTARLSNSYFTDWERDAIEQWCLQHIGQVLPLTNRKDPGMDALWDDRAIQVERNTGRRIDGVQD